MSFDDGDYTEQEGYETCEKCNQTFFASELAEHTLTHVEAERRAKWLTTMMMLGQGI